MKLASIGSDHRGYLHKEELRVALEEKGWKVLDRGCEASTPKVDYPDFAERVCADVVGGQADTGLLICGSGIGMSIAANKVRGIRAALCRDAQSAKMARQHNNANVLVLAGDLTDLPLANEILDAWLDARFEGGRHQRRLTKLVHLEEGG